MHRPRQSGTLLGLIAVIVALAGISATASAAKTTYSGTYKGTASAITGTETYGKVTFKLKKNVLQFYEVTNVAQQCRFAERMHYGFTNAANVRNAYKIPASKLKVKNGKLDFSYSQPGHIDVIRVKVKFGKKTASGTVVQTPAPGDLTTLNCQAGAKFSIKK